jgi:hypothetical protein
MGPHHCIAAASGKESNFDLCIACGEGGALLLCDSCPAAYHLDCLPEPLQDSQLPEGEWYCSRCNAIWAKVCRT